MPAELARSKAALKEMLINSQALAARGWHKTKRVIGDTWDHAGYILPYMAIYVIIYDSIWPYTSKNM